MMRKMEFIMAMLILLPMVAFSQFKDPKLEVVASFGNRQPIGVSVSSDNRVFVSFPRREPYVYGLIELQEGKEQAFPDQDGRLKFVTKNANFIHVQDIYMDIKDVLWVLDSKPAAASSIFGKDAHSVSGAGQFTLYAFDLKGGKELSAYHFDDLDKSKSALNDVRVDTEKELAYLSDPGQAGIVVLDLKSGKTRTVLKGSHFTKADPDLVLRYHGREMRDSQGNPFRSNVNGIALTKDNVWFYFKPINETKLYRIQTKYLADDRLKEEDLLNVVEDMGEVGITHGLVADVKGNIYLTNSMDYAIRRLTPEGKLELIVQDDRLLWPDSLGVGSDGYLYFSCAQLQMLPNWNGGKDLVKYPFQVYRVKVL